MPRPVFLAAPERGLAAIGLLDKILVELQIASDGALGPAQVFAPHVNLGDPGVDLPEAEWFTRTLTALNDARVVVAAVDGAQADEHVAFLLGYAFAAGKPIVALRTDGRPKGALLENVFAEEVAGVRALAAALARRLAE